MRKLPISLDECIENIKELSGNIEYSEIEGVLTWAHAYLKDLKDENKKLTSALDKIDSICIDEPVCKCWETVEECGACKIVTVINEVRGAV